MGGFVYIMASKRYGTIYTGVTSDLLKRVWEHRNEVIPGFTKRYHLHTLVWFERHETIQSAIQREHNIKHWKREWKTTLVDATNPDWDDLYPSLF
jgi:putative endonuclease